MILIAIPARLQSTRLEKKLLSPIGDYPLLWWTWQKAKQSKLAQKIIIATDSQEIFDVMTSFGADCVMTPADCSSGSDRIFQATKDLQEAKVIVNLQGDEPLMKVEILEGTIQTLLNNPDCDIATAVAPFNNLEDWQNPNNVKAVFNEHKRALYFSRAPLANGHLHIGLYVFRKESLGKFCSFPNSSLEKAERLEQLRALENNLKIYVYKSNELGEDHFGIDTPDDLERAKKILLK
ncbi:MAG: 3-deoxy-manno-octulosonate cytidylyltransferase [Candidatus Caenarcaniphilales bacterium]|nr:3-deoxy-manno-octulosonate cytidylyltransferase [Candidatus Caenarcaniphilales bacterium]